jgi:hypothetical protein
VGNIRRLGGAFVLFLVAGAVALAGCGSSDSGEDASTQPTGTGSAQGAAAAAAPGEQAQSAGSSSKGGTHKEAYESGSGSTGASADDGSPAKAAGASAPKTKAKLVKNFKVVPLRVSGGGSSALIVKGGDNSIQEYGDEAGESELAEAAEAVHNYYVAFSQDDWATACSYLSKSIKEGFEQLSSRSGGDKMSCEEISAGLYRDRPSTERSELTKVDAISLRREGDQAFLLYHGPEYDTGGSYGPGDLYAMSLRFEDGGWKMGSATGTSMGIAKSLVNG